MTAVSTEEVPHGKPAPDVYLTVADRLGALRAARRSRIPVTGCVRPARRAWQVVAVPHPRYPPDPDALALARLVLHDLSELAPDLIAGLG